MADIEYADDIALLVSDPSGMQAISNELKNSATLFGIRFLPPKCKVLLQDWVGSNRNILADEPINMVDHFNYLGSLIGPGGLAKVELTQRIAKARVAFANLRYLWRRREISLSIKVRVHNAVMLPILLYGSETWPLRAEDSRRISMFAHRCLRSIARVWWCQQR